MGRKYILQIIDTQSVLKKGTSEKFIVQPKENGIFNCEDGRAFEMSFKDDNPLDSFILYLSKADTNSFVFINWIAPLAKRTPFPSGARFFTTLVYPDKGGYFTKIENIKKGENLPVKLEIFEGDKVIQKTNFHTNGSDFCEIFTRLGKIKKKQSYRMEITLGEEKASSEIPNTHLLKTRWF